MCCVTSSFLTIVMATSPLSFSFTSALTSLPLEDTISSMVASNEQYAWTYPVFTFNKVIASSAPLFDALQILKLNHIFKFHATSFVYECLNNLAPIYFSDYFVSIHSVHNIGTRQSKKSDLFALRCNTTQYGLRSIHYLGVRIWNSLPIEIRESPSLSIFKKKLKDFLLASYKIEYI